MKCFNFLSPLNHDEITNQGASKKDHQENLQELTYVQQKSTPSFWTCTQSTGLCSERAFSVRAGNVSGFSHNGHKTRLESSFPTEVIQGPKETCIFESTMDASPSLLLLTFRIHHLGAEKHKSHSLLYHCGCDVSFSHQTLSNLQAGLWPMQLGVLPTVRRH